MLNLNSLFTHQPHRPFISPPAPPPPGRNAVVRSSVASPSPEKKTRRRRKQQNQRSSGDDLNSRSSRSSLGILAVSAAERALRFTFMEELMTRARDRDAAGVTEVIYDMIAAGLSPGPRSFHGLVVSNVLNGDVEGAVIKKF